MLCGLNNVSSSSCISYTMWYFDNVMLLFQYNLPCLNYVIQIFNFDMLANNQFCVMVLFNFFMWWFYLISLCGGFT